MGCLISNVKEPIQLDYSHHERPKRLKRFIEDDRSRSHSEASGIDDLIADVSTSTKPSFKETTYLDTIYSVSALIYHASFTRQDPECWAEDVANITTQASLHNPAYFITGCLAVYQTNAGEMRLLQYIEGPKENVDQLLLNIRNDSRVDDIHVRYYGSLSHRLLNDWEMYYCSMEKMRELKNRLVKEMVHTRNNAVPVPIHE